MLYQEDQVVPDHFMSYLFKKWMETVKLPPESPMLQGAQAFARFADGFMTQVRPASVGYQGDNFEIQLTNADRVLLAPLVAGAAPNTGEMQPSSYIPVTGKRTDDVMHGRTQPESTQPQVISGQQDMTVDQGMKHYDKPY